MDNLLKDVLNISAFIDREYLFLLQKSTYLNNICLNYLKKLFISDNMGSTKYTILLQKIQNTKNKKKIG